MLQFAHKEHHFHYMFFQESIFPFQSHSQSHSNTEYKALANTVLYTFYVPCLMYMPFNFVVWQNRHYLSHYTSDVPSPYKGYWDQLPFFSWHGHSKNYKGSICVHQRSSCKHFKKSSLAIFASIKIKLNVVSLPLSLQGVLRIIVRDLSLVPKH